MRQTILILLILIASNSFVKAQIVTDRSDQTESSTTIPNKSSQLEMGVANENYKSEQSLLLPTTLFRYGLTKSIELRFVEQLVGFNKSTSSKTEFGLSDVELGAKIQVFKKEDVNTKIAFISHLIIPTGNSELTNTYFGTVNKLAVSHNLNNFLELGYNLGYNYFGTGNGDLTYSMVLGIGLSDKFGTYVETYGEYANFTDFISNIDGGVTYLLKENLQLDFSVGLGLTHEMNYFSIGFSWNINSNHTKNKQQ